MSDITDSLYNDLLNEKQLCVHRSHGSLGEDGCVQGLLEILELPYVGSGVLAALGMNKAMAKEIQVHSIPTPSGILLERGEGASQLG